MVNFNGALLDKNSKLFKYTNRAFLYGDVLFENVRVINGQPIFWEDHYFRLMASMRILRMEIPMEFTMEFLEQQIKKTLESNELLSEPCMMKLAVFRNAGAELLADDNDISFLIVVSKLDHPFYVLKEDIYEVELFKDYFVNHDMLSKLSTGNQTMEVVAGIFAKENGYNDCLLLNTSKQVVGSLLGPIFLVKEGKIKTPSNTGGAKNVVVRKKLIEIIESLNTYELEEASISPFELQKADELFLVNTSLGICPITKYRKKVYENKVAKDLLGKLNANARLASLK